MLAAIVEAEGIEVTDDELERRCARPPGRTRATSGQAGAKRARSQGADEVLREDIAMRKAVDLLVENAKPIPVEQAEARGKIWTPDKEKEEGAGQI